MSTVLRTRRAANRGGRSAESMAGWLFADLLLVLFIVGLGSQVTAASEPAPEPAPPPVEQEAPVMRQEATTVEIEVNAEALLSGDPAEQQRVAQEIAAATAGLADSQAVLVLIFGHAPDPAQGVAISEAVGEVITTMPAPFTPETQTRAFWKGSTTPGTVRLEIFVLDNPPTAA